MAINTDFPTPRFIEGGCLCGACRYRIDFPEDHDFKNASGSCQCTQCRKHTGAVFYFWHRVLPGFKSFKWTTGNPPAALKIFKASPNASRYFCGTCGSFLIWKPDDQEYVSFPTGTVDALYMFGEGADGHKAFDGQVVPKEGYGLALMYGGGGHEYCKNTIPGITDNIPFLYRGDRIDEEREIIIR